MRLFVAIPISQELIQKIEGTIPSLQKLLAPNKTKWVEPQNLHLTLKFFGETAESDLPQIKKSLLHSVGGISPFQISFRGIGFFPKVSFAKVLWVGIMDTGSSLTDLAKRVEEKTVTAGFKRDEREFSAHLTLARFPLPLKETGKMIEDQFKSLDLGTLEVDRIQLIQSVLSSGGPTYHILEEYPFPHV